MSAIGPGSIGALNIAGSFAGSQRSSETQTDRAKAESADQKFQIDQKAMSAHSLGDVAETDLSAERDPDGRMPYGELAEKRDSAELEEERRLRSGGSEDAFGERGGSLDLEA